MTLVLEDESCWLSRLPLVPGEPDANAVIYRKGWYWCRTSPYLMVGVARDGQAWPPRRLGEGNGAAAEGWVPVPHPSQH